MTKAPNRTDVEVGARILLRRKQLGLSQERLAEQLGVSFQQVQKYEKGVNRIGAGRLADIAKALNVPVSFFFDNPERAENRQASPTNVLSVAGAGDLLVAYGRIESAQLRRLVLELARGLAPQHESRKPVASAGERHRSRARS
jgi:transcriptional regulator with XRE-family HTH domain